MNNSIRFPRLRGLRLGTTREKPSSPSVTSQAWTTATLRAPMSSLRVICTVPPSVRSNHTIASVEDGSLSRWCRTQCRAQVSDKAGTSCELNCNNLSNQA